MYAFKVVVTTFLAVLIVISGVATRKSDKEVKAIGYGIGVILACAIGAIWL